jgi:hypothetical protein
MSAVRSNSPGASETGVGWYDPPTVWRACSWDVVMERILLPASSGWEEMGGVSGADPTTDGSGMPWKDEVLG